MRLRDRIRYHVYARRGSGANNNEPEIVERGIGSLLYHNDCRGYFKGVAQSVACSLPGSRVSIIPEGRMGAFRIKKSGSAETK